MLTKPEVGTGLLAGLGLGALTLAVPMLLVPRQAAAALPPDVAELAVQRATGDALTVSVLGLLAGGAAALVARSGTVRAGRTAGLAAGSAAPLSVLVFVVSGLLWGNAVGLGG